MRQKFAYTPALALLCLLFGASAALAQTTSFSYQGRLTEGGAPSTGTYDMKFRLYDTGGNPQGSPDTVTFDNPGVQVTTGVFTVQLDFGAGAFDGNARFLEISVRPHSADPNSPAYTTLSPRQQIISTPYAMRSSTAVAADTATTAATATTATTATTAANFSGSLSGDVTGTQSATVVASVGGQTAANVASGAGAANAATDGNTAGAIVRRDASGNFSAGTITAALNGNASTATTATTATNFSGSLAGDVTGTQTATTVASVSGVSAANVASGATAANGATDGSTPGAIVKRDASGNFAAGTITAALNGNASTATSAASATNFSGSLSGDVNGTQGATVVASVGGQSAANIASGVAAANGATSANTAGAVVSRDASGNFSAGTITATLNGNASTATTATTATNATNATTAATADAVSASAGDSVITAINAGSSTINAARLPSTLATQNGTNTFGGTNTFSTSPTFSAGLSAGGQRVTSVATPTAASDAATKAYVDANTPSLTGTVTLLPSATQTATQASGATRALIDVKLVGTDNLGTTGDSDLLSLKASGTYSFYTGGAPDARDQERFRVDNTGGFAAFGDLDIGRIPAEGAGTRFMWLPYKGATRGGYVNGTQWDDANVGYWSTAFGYNVRASGDYGFAAGRESVAANTDSIALGNFVTASGAASVALGYYAHTNTRQGSFVFSDRSVVDDGNFATDESFKATVNHSFNVRATGGLWFFTNTAVNTGLRLSHLLSTNTAYGSFVWTDRSSDTAVTPTAQNQTIFRSSGGYWLYSSNDLSAGVTLAPGGGSWTSVSDRNVKANFAAVNTREILRGVLSLPISTWNYKTQDASIRHIGPMAQDFFATFKVGEGEKTITTIDPDGVALAAIQGLNEELKDRDAKIDSLQQQLRQQQAQIDGLKKLLCLNHADAAVCKEGR